MRSCFWCGWTVRSTSEMWELLKKWEWWYLAYVGDVGSLAARRVMMQSDCLHISASFDERETCREYLRTPSDGVLLGGVYPCHTDR